MKLETVLLGNRYKFSSIKDMIISVEKVDDFNTGGSRSDQTYAQEIFESAAMPTNGWIETYYKDLYTTIY